MLKNTLGKNGFFGRGAPDVFMSDNCDAMRNAIQEVWPDSLRLFCLFHILQQV